MQRQRQRQPHFMCIFRLCFPYHRSERVCEGQVGFERLGYSRFVFDAIWNKLNNWVVKAFVYFNRTTATTTATTNHHHCCYSAATAIEINKPNRYYDVEAQHNIYPENHRSHGWLGENWLDIYSNDFWSYATKMSRTNKNTQKVFNWSNWNVPISILFYFYWAL